MVPLRGATGEPDIFDYALSFLASAEAEVRTAHDGDVLILSGQPLEALCLVLGGAVRIASLTGETILMHAPCIVGEISFLSGRPTTADVRAVGDVRYSMLPRVQVEQLLTDAAAANRFYRSLSRLAVDRLSGAYHARYTALVAHDGKKDDLIEMVRAHRDHFAGRSLVATATTARRLSDELGLEIVRRVRSGPLGGDQEIGALVSRGLVDAVFFFRDPLWAQPHGADVHALVRVCELMNVPLATNRATAEAILGQVGAARDT
jgi:methylglyoxal synthase